MGPKGLLKFDHDDIPWAVPARKTSRAPQNIIYLQHKRAPILLFIRICPLAERRAAIRSQAPVLIGMIVLLSIGGPSSSDKQGRVRDGRAGNNLEVAG
jgi:hypothetical protein